MAQAQTFGRWILQQHVRNDRIGDLARDAKADPDWPRDAQTRPEYVRHLEGVGAAQAALDAFADAWSEYEAG